MDVLVRELMTCDPMTIQDSMPLKVAAELLVQEGLSLLYVVDKDDRLVGVVSDYELLKIEFAYGDRNQPVSTVMSRSPLTFTPDDGATAAACIFRDGRYTEGIVLEDGHPVGQIHRRDVLRMMVATRTNEIDNSHDGEDSARPQLLKSGVRQATKV
ncbi:MAG: hypothetical protein CMJ78_27615 [Planctomycetaceae bacterium]|nr:hypothetical protein [Planctomycetaceae bacterium]